MKKTLTFTTEKTRTLFVRSFENWTSGCSTTEPFDVEFEGTPEDIHKKVLEIENKQRTKFFGEHRRDVVYCYWVTEYEIMTDDRSEFGHSNQSSMKEIAVVVNPTYVRGEVMTIAQAIAKIHNGEFSAYSAAGLLNTISMDLKFDMENLAEDQLSTKVMKIQGEGRRETFFEVFPESGNVKVFEEIELLPFKKVA